MRFLPWPLQAGAVAALGLATVALTAGLSLAPASASPVSAPPASAPPGPRLDISANADPYTGYAEYCTGNASTPESFCNFTDSQPAPGWFMIGGTSMSTPLWAAMTADRDSYTGLRTGSINPLLYLLFNSAPSVSGYYFHDITGIGPAQQAATSNGLFPTTPGYDMATGIGTPEMTALITRSGP
jgi:hypothetical protein